MGGETMRRGYFSLGVKDLFTPKGRIDRLTCFMYSVALSMVGRVIGYGVAFAVPVVNPHDSDEIATYLFAANWVLVLPLMYSQFCVYAKRLHDMNLPAVLGLFPFLMVGCVIFVVFGGAMLPGQDLNSLSGGHPAAAILGGAGLFLLFDLIVYFVPGTKGPNRYGTRDMGEALPKARILEG
jgi:uncharacterized membrane protein YhaH (DUF805 family)